MEPDEGLENAAISNLETGKSEGFEREDQSREFVEEDDEENVVNDEVIQKSEKSVEQDIENEEKTPLKSPEETNTTERAQKKTNYTTGHAQNTTGFSNFTTEPPLYEEVSALD